MILCSIDSNSFVNTNLGHRYISKFKLDVLINTQYYTVDVKFNLKLK